VLFQHGNTPGSIAATKKNAILWDLSARKIRVTNNFWCNFWKNLLDSGDYLVSLWSRSSSRLLCHYRPSVSLSLSLCVYVCLSDLTVLLLLLGKAVVRHLLMSTVISGSVPMLPLHFDTSVNFLAFSLTTSLWVDFDILQAVKMFYVFKDTVSRKKNKSPNWCHTVSKCRSSYLFIDEQIVKIDGFLAKKLKRF